MNQAQRFLYVAVTIDGKFCKIGATKDLERRLDSIRRWSYTAWGIPVRYIAAWACLSERWRVEEAALHSRFAKLRVSSEWYHASAELVEYAAKMNNVEIVLPTRRNFRRSPRNTEGLSFPRASPRQLAGLLTQVSSYESDTCKGRIL